MWEMCCIFAEEDKEKKNSSILIKLIKVQFFIISYMEMLCNFGLDDACKIFAVK